MQDMSGLFSKRYLIDTQCFLVSVFRVIKMYEGH